MPYIDRPLDNSIGTDMTLREGCDLINDNFEVLAIDKLKLDGIEVGAQVNTITSVAGQTGDVVLTKSDVGLNNVDNTADIDKSVAFAQNSASSEALEGSSLSDVQTFVTNRTGDTSTLTTSATELSSAINELDSEKFDKTGGTISGDVTVSGDLTVNGTSFTVNTQEVLVEDNTITVNNGEVGAGVTAGTAGIIVDRGLSPDYEFVFDEASDTFRVGQTGGTQAVATREDSPIDAGIAVWDDTSSQLVTTLDPVVNSVKLSGGDVDEGTMSWNIDEQTVDLTLGNSVLQIGQEFLVNVRNSTGTTIPNGTPLMFTGTLGASGRILVAPMDGTDRENYKRIVGFATENIPAGTDGKATALGKVRGIDTTGAPYGETWSEGDVIYISPTIVGGLTKVEPSSTGLDMAVAIVVNVHASVGTLYLRVLPIDRNRISPAVQDALDGKLDLTGGVIPPSQLPSATETEKGVVEKATNGEALSGTVDKFPDAAGVHAAFKQFGLGDSGYTAGDTLIGGGNRIVNKSPVDGGLPNVGGYSDRSSVIVMNSGGHQSWIQVTDHGLYFAWGYNSTSLPAFKKALTTNDLMPIGATYIQFPGYAAPSTLFGGTWSQIFNTEGVFFRTEGGNASAFGGGIQGGSFQSHTHSASTSENGSHYHLTGTSVEGNSADYGERARFGLEQIAAGRRASGGSGDGSPRYSPKTNNSGSHSHTVTVGANGGVETRPVNRTIRVWVRIA